MRAQETRSSGKASSLSSSSCFQHLQPGGECRGKAAGAQNQAGFLAGLFCARYAKEAGWKESGGIS